MFPRRGRLTVFTKAIAIAMAWRLLYDSSVSAAPRPPAEQSRPDHATLSSPANAAARVSRNTASSVFPSAASSVSKNAAASASQSAASSGSQSAAPPNDSETVEAGASESPLAANEIYHIYTRHLGRCCYPPPVRVYRRLDCRWMSAELSDTLAPFPGLLVVFVHGNRMELDNTLNRGMLYYRRLLEQTGLPVRFVIWSWPSEKVSGLVRDVRLKADRADHEGVYLAWFLSQTAQPQISLVGYSYGSRVICSALHTRARGGVPGLPLPVGGPLVRVVLGAAAMHNDGLTHCGQYGRAMSQVDQMLVMINHRDPVLKRYHYVERGARPQALGYTGLRGPTPLAERIFQLDATSAIGRSHFEPLYLQNCAIQAEMQRRLLWK